MEENKKKKSFVYAIIAVAVLLVAIAGATYAYFSATVNNGANLGVNGSIDNGSQLFTSYSTGDILFENITADNMTLDKHGLLQTKSATVTVEYTAGSSLPSVCTYDLVFNWETGYVYTPSPKRGTALELSYQITGSGEGTSKGETQITSGIILSGERITSSNSVKATNTYNIAMKFYNLTTSQNELGGKTFKGKWQINNVECKAQTPVAALITDKNGIEYTKADLSLGQVIEYANGKYVTVVDLNADGHYKLADGSDANAVVALTDSNGKLISLTGSTVAYQAANTSNYYGSSDLKTTIDSYYTTHASELSFLKQWQVEAANETREYQTANGVTMLNVYLAAPSSSEIFGEDGYQGNTDESVRQFGYSSLIGDTDYFWLRSPRYCGNGFWIAYVSDNGDAGGSRVNYGSNYAAVGVGCL